MSDLDAVSGQRRFELNFLEDWREAMGEAKTALLQNPIPTFLLVVVAIVGSMTPLKLVDVANECVVWYISCAIIKAVWLRLQRVWQPDFINTDYKGFEAKIVAVNFRYGLGVIVLGMLLVVPGIWWGVRCSLAMAIVCIENTSAGKALERSRELTKGHFWRCFRYIFGGPLLMMVPIIIANCILGSLEQVYGSELQASAMARIADVGLNALVYILTDVWQLCIAAIMVRLYTALLQRQISTTSV